MTEDVSAELDAVCVQLDALRRSVASEVESTWTSPWKSPETVTLTHLPVGTYYLVVTKFASSADAAAVAAR